MEAHEASTMSTGIEGLDEVLVGGLSRRRTYLVEGETGTGKTTLALQWLMDGVARGERCLYISLSETADELKTTMASHGWNADDEGLSIVALNEAQTDVHGDAQYTMFHPSEVELGETFDRLLAEVERAEPDRLVIDSLSEVRLLSQDALRFRNQMLGLKEYLMKVPCTALFVSQQPTREDQAVLYSLVHGVFSLRQTIKEFGSSRRRLRVIKLRDRAYQEGEHDLLIHKGGIRLFARLPSGAGGTGERTPLSSGKERLDMLLGGGLTRGTSTLFMGPTGSGKSSVMTQYVAAALQRGQGATVFTFDERRDVFLDRAAGMGLDLSEHVASGLLAVEQVDPGQLSPGAFAGRIRHAVEAGHAELLAIDSLNGLLSSMQEERFVLIHLHEVLDFLAGRGVTSILTSTQPAVFGSNEHAPVNVSYLADAVLLFRYFERNGAVRKGVSMLKKRIGNHEKSMREFWIESDGIEVGAPLVGWSGVLSGVPTPQGPTPGPTEHGDG